MVPMLQCGFERLNFSLAIVLSQSVGAPHGPR
jgi:hypothetical protein